MEAATSLRPAAVGSLKSSSHEGVLRMLRADRLNSSSVDPFGMLSDRRPLTTSWAGLYGARQFSVPLTLGVQGRTVMVDR